MSDPIPLDIQPGIVKTLSEAATGRRWIDSDKIRFNNGKPEKILGCEKYLDDAVTGLARGMLGWITLDGDALIAAGTATKLYSISDQLQDITPQRTTGTLGTDPFDTTDMSAVVTVTHSLHGLQTGATANFDGATAVGGITIDGDYLVTVVDSNSYTITHSSAATSTATGGGSAVDYGYEINPGLEDTSYGLGFGTGPYGEEEYGTMRSGITGVQLELRQWFFANRLGFVYALPSGGTLYSWDQNSGDARALAVSNAPASARAMFVSNENIPILLGTTSPVTLQWPDRDDVTDWTSSDINTAGERYASTGNKLIAGTALSNNNLIWTDTAVYTLQWIDGLTIVYDLTVAGENCGLISPMAFCAARGMAFWMAFNEFHLYSGGVVQAIANSPDIKDAIFHAESSIRMDRERAAKTWCGYNHRAGEIWWGYVSVNSADGEPDRYVKVNLADYSWDVGTWTRTCMTRIPHPNGDVVMAGANSYIYRHETTLDDDGAAMEAYIQTGIVPLRNGKTDIDVDGYIPDFQRQSGDVTLNLWTKDRPQSASNLYDEDFTIAEGDTVVDTRLGGRYLGFKLTSNALDGDFRLGLPMLEVGPGGEGR